MNNNNPLYIEEYKKLIATNDSLQASGWGNRPFIEIAFLIHSISKKGSSAKSVGS